MLRLKHPGVARALEPMEESAAQIVLVTEPLLGSLYDLMTGFRGVPAADPSRQAEAAKLSPLEIKYGLCQLAETLQFLHAEARLAHHNVNPESVVVARDGAWKLAGFAFVGPAAAAGDGGSMGGGGAVAAAFDYSGAGGGLPLWDEVLQPPLAYTAPELVAGSGVAGAATAPGAPPPPAAAADVFSLGALALDLLSGRAPPAAGGGGIGIGEYRARFGAMAGADVSGAPPPAQAPLRAMLAAAPGARPAAGAALAESAWVRDDVALRALRFLDTMLQREPAQKVCGQGGRESERGGYALGWSQ